jgi:phosphate starvation-inducible protein PhoH
VGNHQTDDTQPAITGRYHGKNDMVFAVGPAGTGKTYTELLWLLKL